MSLHYSPTHFIAPIAAVCLLALTAGCSKPADDLAAGAASAAPANTVSSVKAASKLGDLSAFQGIASDVATLIDLGDMAGAKTRIKVLEAHWDAAEAGLKPRAAEDWHVLDKALDHALDALRADPPKQTDCKMAVKQLLTTFNVLQGHIWPTNWNHYEHVRTKNLEQGSRSHPGLLDYQDCSNNAR